MTLAVVGSGVPTQEWGDATSDLLSALGWRSGHDRFSPPPADSATLDVLDQLSGASRLSRRQRRGVDLAVAATARTAIRPDTWHP